MTNTEDDPGEDWDKILPQLLAFTKSLTSDLNWFRGGKTASFLQGKEVVDYVYEAIGRYLKDKSKYDKKRGTLINYLKYNLIRGIVANDLRKLENKKTDDVFGASFNGDEDGDSDLSYEDLILPCTEPLFVDDADYHKIKDYIKEQINGDEITEDIFLGYEYSYRRREIIEEFNLSESDYNNGIRRLQTVISRASHFFNPNKSKI